jgi:hypothetical protein
VLETSPHLDSGSRVSPRNWLYLFDSGLSAVTYSTKVVHVSTSKMGPITPHPQDYGDVSRGLGPVCGLWRGAPSGRAAKFGKARHQHVTFSCQRQRDAVTVVLDSLGYHSNPVWVAVSFYLICCQPHPPPLKHGRWICSRLPVF